MVPLTVYRDEGRFHCEGACAGPEIRGLPGVEVSAYAFLANPRPLMFGTLSNRDNHNGRIFDRLSALSSPLSLSHSLALSLGDALPLSGQTGQCDVPKGIRTTEPTK